MIALSQAVLVAALLLVIVPLASSEFVPLPVIDLGPWINNPEAKDQPSQVSVEQQKIVDNILQACRTIGFFLITNHGVEPKTIQEAWHVAANFFELPTDEKLRYKSTNETEYPYGYEQQEQLTRGKALDRSKATVDDGTAIEESKETFAIGPNDSASGMPLRRWKSTPNVPKFQSALESYYKEMESLALQLLELFALALGQPVNYFEDKMDHHLSALRLIHYYPLKQERDDESKLIVRAGAHTDYGALTILNAAQPGLQVLRYDDGNRSRAEWYSVPVVPGALVINLGDLMQRWTNDEWVSTLHRVVMSTSASKARRRYSMAFFVNVNGDTMIEALTTNSNEERKYPPISARDHLMAKHLASMGLLGNHDEL